MARKLDPSELDGEELFNWYRRSPSEVEAERTAARQDAYDRFVNSIGAAGQPEARDNEIARIDMMRGLDLMTMTRGLVQARYFRPGIASSIAPPMAAPSGLRVGPSLDALGAPPTDPAASGFFGQHNFVTALGGYSTDLPSPLNFVTSMPGPGWWQIGDGSLVRADEVERIYAEQKRRLSGRDGAEPAGRVRTVDRLPDGQIPRVDQMEKGERELDPTCAPYGGWERDPNFGRYSKRTQQYETQVTHAPGLDYVVRNPSSGR